MMIRSHSVKDQVSRIDERYLCLMAATENRRAFIQMLIESHLRVKEKY